MRIAYGVHGYGRGHAMRALAVLPALRERHEVLVLAGGDAHQALWPDYPVVRIPTFRYYYTAHGKLSNYLNAKRNASAVLDLMCQGPALQMVMETLEEFRPDVVVSDSEAFTHRAARRLRIPRISFDHFGLLVYCRPEMSTRDRLICAGNAFVYRRLFGEPERAIVSSFFDAPTVRDGVRVVGPVIRKEVRATTPARGNHLLVYLSMGEVIHFGKPILGLPIACLEQRLNADQIGRLGIGTAVRRGRVTAEVIRAFLAREPQFAANCRREARDGAREAIEEFTEELTGRPGAGERIRV